MGDPERKFRSVVTEKFPHLLEPCVAAESLFCLEKGAAKAILTKDRSCAQTLGLSEKGNKVDARFDRWGIFAI